VSAWQWAASDTIVHALPLHHVHGIINALYCPHVVGAAVNFLPSFSPAAVWEQLQVTPLGWLQETRCALYSS
jgi:malonyl-CoA/methylmalonyl-CoA synthetase